MAGRSVTYLVDIVSDTPFNTLWKHPTSPPPPLLPPGALLQSEANENLVPTDSGEPSDRRDVDDTDAEGAGTETTVIFPLAGCHLPRDLGSLAVWRRQRRMPSILRKSHRGTRGTQGTHNTRSRTRNATHRNSNGH